jgi:hypothetical protein
MGFVILFLLSAMVAIGLEYWTGYWFVSVPLPPIFFAALVVFDVYVLPHPDLHGHGNALWPIAVMFGSPVALLGAICGVVGFRWYRRRA